MPDTLLALFALLTNPFVAALLVVVAAVAIAAELKAGASGLGVLVSFVSMGLFFTASVAMGLAGWAEVMLALLGVIALAVEVFLLPGFGVAGVLGLGFVGTAILLAMLGPAPTAADVAAASLALLTAFAVTAAVIYGWVRRLPANNRLRGLLLRESMDSTAGYISGVTRADLVGREGRAVTALRPAGVAEVGGERLDVVTEGDWLPQGSPIVVMRSEGYRLLVRAAPVAALNSEPQGES